MVLVDEIRAKLTLTTSRYFRSLNHAYYHEHSARICLQTTESGARKRQLEEEEQQTRKRLKKADNEQCWDLKDLCRARGMNEQEINLLLAQRANNSNVYTNTE